MKRRLTYALLASAGAGCAFIAAAFAAQKTDAQTQKPDAPDAQVQRTTPAIAKQTPDLTRAPIQNLRIPNAPNPPAFESSTAKTSEVRLTAETVRDFLLWAATSPRDQKEKVRAEINRVAGDEKIGAEIQRLYPEILADDFDFALVALSVLGELRAKNSLGFFREVVGQQYPEEKVAADPGLTRRESIELLQSKAVQGAAYLKSADANAFVLETAKGHPSRAVRAAAIEAYLFNASNPEAARKQLQGVIAPVDLPLLDTVQKGAMRSTEEFNKQLAAFYAKYPNEVAAAPGDPQGPEQADRIERGKDENRAPGSGKRKPR